MFFFKKNSTEDENNKNQSRKEKSLGLLCCKFLHLYPPDPIDTIIIRLDDMADNLRVERRRIYDIVNVLESVEILSRLRKNQYQWHGFTNIPQTLSKLKTLAVKSNFLEYTKLLMMSHLESADDLHQDIKQAYNVCFEQQQEQHRTFNRKCVKKKDAMTQTISISREEKSLGIMSQKFLMLFLTAEDGLVSINFAARVLLGDSKNDTTELGRFKTKIRRLYDIANVLSSIGLIQKYLSNDANISKPAYRYIGPQVQVMRYAEYVYDFVNTGNQMSNSKHSLFDHFKRNLELECNIPQFDVNTGILTSKDKRWKRNLETSKPTYPQKKIKKETIVNRIYDIPSAVSSSDSINNFLPFLNINTQQQNDLNHSQLSSYRFDDINVNNNYIDNTHLYSNQFNLTNDDIYANSNSYVSSSSSNTTEYISDTSSLTTTSSSSISYQKMQNENFMQSNWKDAESVFVDSISPLAVPYLPSFSTFLS